MFLVDTNVISELRKAGDGKAHANVLAWLSSADAVSLYVSAITLLELELGVLRMEGRDAGQGARLRAWMDGEVRPEFADGTLAIDTTVALRCAALHVPALRPERDALIAATALVHGLTVVRRSIGDFDPMRVPVLNPWDNPRPGAGS